MGKRLVFVQDVGLTRLQVTCKISFQFLVLQPVPPEGLPGKASTLVAGPPVRHGGTSVSPVFWGGFPPLHLAVSPAVKRWRRLRAGPCVSQGGPAPPQPLQLALGGVPLKAPSCAAQGVHGQGVPCLVRAFWGGKMCPAPGQAVPAAARSPLLWDGCCNPCDDVGFHFKSPAPGITGMWAHSFSLLFFFHPSLILSCFQPSLRRAQKFDS